MDIFFQDPNEVRLPPDQVRIRELQAEVREDKRRVRVYLEVDPFQKRPSADLDILDAYGETIAQTCVIESMTRKIELTMHLRGEALKGPFSLVVTLYFQAPPAEPQKPDAPPQLEPALVVDRKEIAIN
jgi:hypothetical protein